MLVNDCVLVILSNYLSHWENNITHTCSAWQHAHNSPRGSCLSVCKYNLQSLTCWLISTPKHRIIWTMDISSLSVHLDVEGSVSATLLYIAAISRRTSFSIEVYSTISVIQSSSSPPVHRLIAETEGMCRAFNCSTNEPVYQQGENDKVWGTGRYLEYKLLFTTDPTWIHTWEGLRVSSHPVFVSSFPSFSKYNFRDTID